MTPGPSGYGLAQTNSEEISQLGLGDLNPLNPVDAITVMEARIASVQGACVGCSPRDMLIVAALAQNRAISSEQIGKMSKGGGDINWQNFFDTRVTQSQLDAKIPQALSGIPFDRRFILLKYIQNMRLLYGIGWTLPDGITEADLDALEESARTGDGF